MRSPSTAGRLCGVRAEQITEPLALHGEGPCWLERSGELAWVDMLAGRILATSLATGATRVIDVPGPVAALVRPREAGGLVVATETGVVLLDEHDAPSHLCEILDEPGMRMNDGGCDPQGRFWCGSMAYDVRPGAASLYRVEADGSFDPMLDGVTISNGLGWSPDGTMAFYVDSMAHGIDCFAFDGASGTISGGDGSPRSRRAWACPTGSRWTPRAASGLRSGTAEPFGATRPTARSTRSSRCPAGA